MAVVSRYSILAIAFVVSAGSAAHAQSCPPAGAPQSVAREFTTVMGKKLILPPVRGMECAEIDNTLARIDSTRYRGNAPQPYDIADCPLLHYELLLAEESYNRCVIVRKKVTGGLRLMKRSASQ
jgi:hypothetical protein